MSSPSPVGEEYDSSNSSTPEAASPVYSVKRELGEEASHLEFLVESAEKYKDNASVPAQSSDVRSARWRGYAIWRAALESLTFDERLLIPTTSRKLG